MRWETNDTKSSIKFYEKFSFKIFQVQTQARPQAIFTSFKLEKNGKSSLSPSQPDNGFQLKTPNHNQSNDNQTDGNSSSKESSSPQFSVNRLSDSSGGSGINDRKRRLSFSTSPSTEADKVSIVRAAGTFFPENCGDEGEMLPTRRKSKENANVSDFSVNAIKKANAIHLNQSNGNQFQCDECSEVC